MKKLFFLVLLSVISVMLCAHNAHKVKDEKEYVEIEKEKEGIEEGRSLSYVECYIDRECGEIEIGYSGIGIPDIIILDSNHSVVCSVSGVSDFGTITLNLPSDDGSYSVLIQSRLYTGKGSFYIF